MCPYETGKEREEGVEKPAALPGPREAPVFGQDLGTVACGKALHLPRVCSCSEFGSFHHFFFSWKLAGTRLHVF